MADVLDAARRKGIDLSNKKKICISLDVNGPLTAANSAALEPYPGIKEAIRELDMMGIYIIINSAWDIYTSKVFDQKMLGGVADGIIGENGLVYAFPDTEPIFAVGIDTSEHILDLFITTLEYCSSSGYSFADQGNLVNACYYHEFERGLTENICRQGASRPSTQEFFETLKKLELDAKIQNNCVEIDNSRESYRCLQMILRKKYKLVTIRPSVRNGRISIQIDSYKDKIISLQDLNELAKRVINYLNAWESYKVNEDFCIDYFLSKNELKKDINKSMTLDMLLDDLCKRDGCDREDVLILGIGDGENDTCVGNIDNALFFGIAGTKSENYCDMKVGSGIEFLQLTKKLTKYK